MEATNKSYLVSYKVGFYPNISERIFKFSSYIEALKYSNMLRRCKNEPTILEC